MMIEALLTIQIIVAEQTHSIYQEFDLAVDCEAVAAVISAAPDVTAVCDTENPVDLNNFMPPEPTRNVYK